MSRRPTPRDAPVYESRTGDVVVRVVASYSPDNSDPVEGRYFWAYTVEIENHGKQTIQLVSRHWIITDALNRVEEVVGDGVVGEQPVLKGGEAFRYTSGCPLKTTSGIMRGVYQMVAKDGEGFEVKIPEFSLHLPRAGKTVH